MATQSGTSTTAPPMNRTWRTVAGVALLSMLAMAFIMVSTSRLHDKGWSTFVIAGSEFVDEDQTPSELVIYPDIVGYDGQQFYRLSRHPLSTDPVVEGIPLDDGPYRQQRILFPLAGWALAAFSGVSTLMTLPLVNLLSVGVLGAAVSIWARSRGRSPWLGVVVALLPPMYFGAVRNLSEPLALALMVVGIMVWQRRPWAGTLLLTLAVLTRETTIVAAAGFGIAAVIEAVRTRSLAPLREQGLPAMVPLAALISWQWYLGRAWGRTSAEATAARVRSPDWSVVTSFFNVNPSLEDPSWAQHLWSLEQLILLFALGVAVWLALRKDSVELPMRISLVLAVAVALLTLGEGWAWAAAFTRAAGEAMILGALVALSSGERFRLYFWPVAILIPLVRISG